MGGGRRRGLSRKDDEFIHKHKMIQLVEMGFEKKKVKRLLLKKNGDMTQVLAALIES